jgi:hypothetical protein
MIVITFVFSPVGGRSEPGKSDSADGSSAASASLRAGRNARARLGPPEEKWKKVTIIKKNKKIKK